MIQRKLPVADTTWQASTTGNLRFTPRLIAERKAREEEERKKAVAVKLETLTQHEARIIGSENLCNSTMREGLEAIKKGIFTKGGIKKRDAVNKRLGKLDKQYGAIRQSYNVTFIYEGTGKNEAHRWWLLQKLRP